MVRPVDPRRHRARRLQIIDAGLTVFSRLGYTDATTATICREAGISSGTFFHYFPTKDSLVVAILREGAAETAEFFATQRNCTDAAKVLFDYVGHAVNNLKDPRAAGFITAVNGLDQHEEIAAVLRDEERDVQQNLAHWVELAQKCAQIRGDLAVARIVEWILLLIAGVASRIATSKKFDLAAEEPILLEILSTFLTRQANQLPG